jgi:hypothetical protein
MAIVMNAKGTTSPYFKIGKQGTNIFQGSSDPSGSYTTAEGDMWIDTSNKITKFRNSSNDGWTQGSLDITGNATISGDLTINGTTTTLDTTNLTVEDPLVILASGVSGTPAFDAGFVVERGSSTNVGFIWDESADEFAVINTTEAGTTAGNVTIASYANIQASSIAGTLTTAAQTNITSVGTLGSLAVSGTVTVGGIVGTSATGALEIPTGTTAQRPGSPATGSIRFNSTVSRFEGYDGSSWIYIDIPADLGST